MRCIKYFLFVVFFYVGFWWANFRYDNSQDWMKGYCWGYAQGRLEQSLGRVFDHNIKEILGLDF